MIVCVNLSRNVIVVFIGVFVASCSYLPNVKEMLNCDVIVVDGCALVEESLGCGVNDIDRRLDNIATLLSASLWYVI